VHLRGHNLVISKSGGEYQTPGLLKIEKTKSMKREIKVIKTDDQPMTTIKIAKSMTNTTMEAMKNHKMKETMITAAPTKIAGKNSSEYQNVSSEN
jgi:hypothetical protein